MASGVIPEHLKLQPGDSDSVRAQKRKKLKALKQKAKGMQVEVASTEKQNSWQSFSKKSSIKGKSRESMFRTPGAGDQCNPMAKVGCHSERIWVRCQKLTWRAL